MTPVASTLTSAQRKPNEQDLYDITIIGAGPTGLFAAFYAGLREMKTKLVEALPEPGGQLAVLYPEKFIYDVAGYPRVLAKDLVHSLWEQAMMFSPTTCLGRRIVELVRPNENGENGLLELTDDEGDVHYSRSVVICAGIGAFSPNKLRNEAVARFEGRGVNYFVHEKSWYRGKNLLIVGGGDSAVDWALNLKDWARHVTLIHRRDGFRALESSVTELTHSPVDVRVFHELKEVCGGEWIEEATIFDNRTGEETCLQVDALLLFLGFKADMGPIKNWGLDLSHRAINVTGKMETNIPGVYAAGDIANPQDSVSLNLIATGFGQAAIAVNCAKNFIDPSAKIFPGHSSEKRL